MLGIIFKRVWSGRKWKLSCHSDKSDGHSRISPHNGKIIVRGFCKVPQLVSAPLKQLFPENGLPVTCRPIAACPGLIRVWEQSQGSSSSPFPRSHNKEGIASPASVLSGPVLLLLCPQPRFIFPWQAPVRS